MGRILFLFDLAGNDFNWFISSTILISFLLLGLVLFFGYLQFRRTKQTLNWSKISDNSTEFKTLLDNAKRHYSLRKNFKRNTKEEVSQAINSIKGLANLGKQEDDQRNQQHYFEKIEESVELLNQYFQKYMGNPFAQDDVSLSEINLHDIIHNVIKENKSKVDVSNVHLFVEVDRQINIISDQARLYTLLEDVVIQMLNSFDKNKKNAYIMISTRMKDHEVYLTLSDNGRGLTSEELPMTFSIYSKSDGYFKNPHMGLFLVKEYAKKLNTGFKVFSEKGEGSMFVFRFNNESAVSPTPKSKIKVN